MVKMTEGPVNICPAPPGAQWGEDEEQQDSARECVYRVLHPNQPSQKGERLWQGFCSSSLPHTPSLATFLTPDGIIPCIAIKKLAEQGCLRVVKNLLHFSLT